MKRSTLVFSAIFVMLAMSLLVAGCTSPSPGGVPPVTTGMTPEPSNCGFTTCHGLELACGANAPQVCTMEYRIGDKCRQYAQCSTTGGSCTLVTSPQFTACKSCIENCEKSVLNDPQRAFACEEKC